MNKPTLKDISYVFFDMDGTVLDKNKNILPTTIQTIEELKKQNIFVSIATGRPYYLIYKEIDILNITNPIISCNSALIYDPKTKTILYSDNIKKSSTKKIYDILTKYNGVFLIYTSSFIIKQKPKETKTSSWLSFVENINKNNDKKYYFDLQDASQINNFDILNYDVIKFLVVENEIDSYNLKKIKEEISQIDDVYIVNSQRDVFDIMPHGHNKGEGLEFLQKQGYIDLSKTLVFGDADNDIPMFLKAKYSVAMGNAHENVKQCATFITKDHNKNGISDFFNDLLK